MTLLKKIAAFSLVALDLSTSSQAMEEITNMLTHLHTSDSSEAYPYAQESARYDKMAEEQFRMNPKNNEDLVFNPQGIFEKLRKLKLKIMIGDSFPSLTPDLLDTYIDLIAEQYKQGNLPIPSETSDAPDYGWSFGAHSYVVERAMLSDVSKRFQETGERSIVGDFAGGHGLTTWQIVALGGCVKYVDKIDSVFQVSKKNIFKAKPFLCGETIKGKCQFIRDDLLKSTCYAYTAKYDVVWSGNFLHMPTPEQDKFIVKNMYNSMNDNAVFYGTVQTADTPEIIEFVLAQRALGIEFPGYIIVNKGFRKDTPFINGERLTNVYPHLTPICHAPEGTVPQLSKVGPYNGASEQEFRVLEDGRHEVITSHMAMMLYEEDSLRKLFEDAGFIVDDLYYEIHEGRAAEKLSPDMGIEGFKLSIIARKPPKI